MQSVGTRLREARERRGFSLDDINSRTRINSKNLSAIESDEVQNIGSPFFYRSFVRQYADAVGLEFQALASGVDLVAGHMRQPDLPGQGEHQVVRVAPLQAHAKRDWSWVLPTAVLVGVIALGSGGYTYLKLYKPTFLQTTSVSSLVRRHSDPTVRTPAVSPEAKKPAVVEERDAEITAANVPDKIRLELAATERTWLTVSADGKPAYTGILEPTQKKVLEGQDSARLKTGNAGGVNIIFNGKAIGAIGPRGQTRTVVFSKTGYEIEPGDGSTRIPSSRIGG